MTKLNSDDFGQPVWSGEPFTPEPLDVQNPDIMWGFELFDRQGYKYHFYLSRPEFGQQLVTAVAQMPIDGIGLALEVIHIGEPEQYGPQPTNEGEALNWLASFTKAWQELQTKSAIVMEPYIEGSH